MSGPFRLTGLSLLFVSLFCVPQLKAESCFQSLDELIHSERAKVRYQRLLGFEDRSGVPIKVVALVIATRSGQILLGQRLNGIEEGTWGVVGGKMDEEDCHLLKCAQREFQEETGLWIVEERFVYLGEITPHLASDGIYYAPYLFRVELEVTETPIWAESDKLESGWHWFELDQLPKPLFSTNAALFEEEGFRNSLR